MYTNETRCSPRRLPGLRVGFASSLSRSRRSTSKNVCLLVIRTRVINPRTAGGRISTPLRCFADAKKTAARLDLKLHSSKFESLSKTHQRSKLFETRSVQYGHRYLRFVYLGCLISVTSGHVNYMTSPL